jgi:hypothetical protein
MWSGGTLRTRRRILVLMATMAFAVVGWVIPAHAGAEGSFVSMMNAERAAHGLPALQVYWDLTDDARAHSQQMASSGTLHHNPNLGSVTSAWQALGENVGVGASVEVLHEAFMGSSAHRGNILGDYNYVGVGVIQDTEATLWVTVVFMKGPAGLVDGGETTTTTAVPTTTTTVVPTTTTTAAPATTTTVAPTVATTAQPAAEPAPEPLDDVVSVPTRDDVMPVGRPGLVHPIME